MTIITLLQTVSKTPLLLIEFQVIFTRWKAYIFYEPNHSTYGSISSTRYHGVTH